MSSEPLVRTVCETIRGFSRLAVVELRAQRGNELTLSLLEQLKLTLRDLELQKVDCVVITGNRHVFSVGVRLEELFHERIGVDLLERLNEVSEALQNYTGVTVAAIDGYALGGGAELALSCNFSVASSNSQIGFPEVSHGIFPGGGATRLLPVRIGRAKSLDLILTGQTLSSQEALEIGLIDYHSGSRRALVEARRLCESFSFSSSTQLVEIKNLLTRPPLASSAFLNLERQTMQDLIANRTKSKGRR